MLLHVALVYLYSSVLASAMLMVVCHVCRRFLLYLMYSVLAFVVMTTVRVGINNVSAKPPQEVAHFLLPLATCTPKAKANTA